MSAHVPGGEVETIGNYRSSTVRDVHLYTIYDAPVATKGVLRWDLFHLDGRRLLRGHRPVSLRPRESVKQKTLNLSAPLAKHGRGSIYLRIALEIDKEVVSEETIFLTPPRFIALPKAPVSVSIRLRTPSLALLTFSSSALQYRLVFDLPGLAHQSSDNFFDLHPGEDKTIEVELSHPQSKADLRQALIWHSLADTY